MRRSDRQCRERRTRTFLRVADNLGLEEIICPKWQAVTFEVSAGKHLDHTLDPVRSIHGGPTQERKPYCYQNAAPALGTDGLYAKEGATE